MTDAKVLDALTEIASSFDLPVRREKGNFRGGRCVVGGEELILLNKRHPPEVNVAILAQSLQDLPLDTVYIRPAVRDVLDAHRRASDVSSADASPSS